ncbi:hypothetical protein V5O48_019603, partial [Marasmius crinis-equi]
RADWKHHRSLCADLAKEPEDGYPLRPTALDWGFMRYLTIRNYLAEGSEANPTSERTWLIDYDYKVFPPQRTAEITPVKGWGQHDQEFEWFETLYPSREDREKRTFIHVKGSGSNFYMNMRLIVDHEGNLEYYEIPHGSPS